MLMKNIAAVLIDRVMLVYEIARGAALALVVRDRGMRMVRDGDHPTREALDAAEILGGHYATCEALGLFRLGSVPDGVVTADTDIPVVPHPAHQFRSGDIEPSSELFGLV